MNIRAAFAFLMAMALGLYATYGQSCGNAISAQVNIDQQVCMGADGEVTVTVLVSGDCPEGGAITAVNFKLLIDSNGDGAEDGSVGFTPAQMVNNGEVSYTFTNLSAGTYALQVKEENSCCDSTFGDLATNPFFELASQGPVVVIDSAASSAPSCGSGGSIDAGKLVFEAQGNPPFTLKRNGQIQAGAQVESLSNDRYQYTGLTMGGEYVVEVSDSCAQTASDTLTLPELIFPEASLPQDSVTLSSCKVDTVTTNLNITSGIPPFNIIRTGVQLGSSQDDPPVSVAVLLNRGENNLIIVGGNGCRDTVTVQAVDPSGPAITNLTPVHATSCIPAASGSVSFHVNNNAAPYSYVLNNDTSEMNFTSPITIDELLPGMYSVFVIDSGECVSNAVAFEIMEAEKPQITMLVPMQADSCVPANSGEMQVAVSGPSRTPAGYQYSTDGGANFTAAFQTDNPFTIPGLAPGTYSIVVKDGGGCESEASEETIDAPEIPVINELNESDPSCADPASGSITVASVSPGNVADYQYSIDPPDKDDFGSSSTFANLQAMTYQIRARDEVGCVSEPKEAVLQIPNSPVASIVLPAEDRAVCQAGDAIELMGNAPGSGETASWQAVTSSSGNIATLDPASVQPGTVEVIYTITRDSDQCQGMASRTIEVLPQPEINESLEYADGQDPVTMKGTRYEVETGRPIVINVNASPASAMHQLSWEATGASQVLLPSPASGSIPFQGSLELDQAASGSIQFRLSDEASYTTNSVPANLSCSSEKTIDIDVTGEVVIPPILSPNGDGQNDVFRLSGIGNPQHFELRIYNRKGALVFQSNDIRTAWTGGNSPDGVYYYKATFNNEERTGAILLQRSVR